MAVKNLIVRGFGFSGSVNYVPTRGYDIGAAIGNIPIFSRIIEKLETLISTYMTQANGFSQNYGSINIYSPDSRTYPAVFIETPEEQDMGPLGLDRVYEQTEVAIRVIIPTSADVAKAANWAISDFGLLLKSFEHTLKVEGLILYDFLGSEIKYLPGTAYPVEIVTRWDFMYRRKLDDLYTPDTTDVAEAFSGAAFDSSKYPIITKITNQIETLIGTMTTLAGYNYTYGTVNQFTPASRTYPAVFISAVTEEVDGDEDVIINEYPKTAVVDIDVVIQSSTYIDRSAFLCRADFDKMFFDNRATLNAQGLVETKYIGSEKEYTLVNRYPVKIKLKYLLHFKVKKNNPYNT